MGFRVICDHWQRTLDREQTQDTSSSLVGAVAAEAGAVGASGFLLTATSSGMWGSRQSSLHQPGHHIDGSAALLFERRPQRPNSTTMLLLVPFEGPGEVSG